MKMSSLRTIKAAFLAAVLVLVGMLAFGYYYSEDFATGASGWTLNYRYGRAGVNANATTTHNITAPSSGFLQFRGRVNSGNSDYLGTWVGRMAFYNATSFVASATNPFGVEFRRTYSRIDPHGDGDANPESHRHMSAMSFWLVRDPNNLQDSAAEFSIFPNSILFYDMMRMTYNTNSGQPRSTWGIYQASEQQVDLTQALRPTGETTNIIQSTTYGLEWNYDDYWGAGTQGTGGTANATPDNNNPVVVRMTHDGSTVRFYINPNPDSVGGNPYPNEFLLVGSAGVSWNDYIRFMVGVESKRTDTEQEDADIDSVLVRSVASSLKAEITPSSIAKGSTNTFQLVVTPTFTANDAGIGEITITKPASYGAINWTPSQVQVFSDKGTGTNHGVISGLQAMTYTAGVPTGNNQAYITASGDTLKIRFRQAANSLTDTGVVNSSTGSTADDRKVVVVFSMASPNTASGTGESFTVKADCVKYNGQLYPRWGTTGQMLAVAGDAHGSVFADDTLTVKRFSNPDALATVTPELVYIGNNRTIYLYVATTDVNAPPVSELRIKVPAGYVVSTADSTKFSSLYIVDDNQHVFATNVAGTDYIYVRYAADSGGLGLPSPGGLDRITIQVDSTPTGFSGAQTNTVWTATAYSSIPGTSGTLCRTNSDYPNRTVIVRTLPPDVSGVAVTPIVSGGTNFLYNHTGYGNITYEVNNNGGAGNTIKRIRVLFPAVITNADAITSTIMGGAAIINYNGGINGFVIDYKAAGKNIPAGGSDTITMTVSDKIVPMSGLTNGSVTIEADNENGDGYVPGTEGAGSWSITWKNPPAAANTSVSVQNSLSSGASNIIPTTDTVSTVRFTIVNTGGSFNNIKLAEILLPAQFTNVLAATSLKLGNTGTNISIVGGRLLVKYYEHAQQYLQNTESDTITVQVADNVGLTAPATATVTLRVANTPLESDLQATGLIPEATKSITFRIPDATAAGYIVPVQINSDTVTNTMTYVISNTGHPDNYLSEVRIYIPDSIASNMIDQTSTHLSDAPGNVSVVTTGYSNYIRLLYHGATNLHGGQTDTITFKMIDHVVAATSFHVVAVASNARNEWKTLSVKSGQTNRVVIQIPPASASGDVTPNVLFTAAVATNKVLVYDLKNTGTGGNSITNATITVPALIKNKFTAISNSMGASYNYSTATGILRLHLTGGAVLSAGATGRIYFVLGNDIAVQQTGLAFTGTVDNGQGPQAITAAGSGSLQLHFITQPTVEIYQSDDTPNQIYSTDSESQFTWKFYNGTTGGRTATRVLIELPHPFVGTGIQMIPSWPGATAAVVSSNITAADGTVVNTTGNEKILITYTASPLDAGGTEELALTVRDVLPQGETNVLWNAWVDYGDGYGFRPAGIAAGKSAAIQFVFPDAQAAAAITPNRVNINTDAGLYSLTVSNSGVPGNSIKMMEIILPPAFTNISGPLSTLAGTTISNQGSTLFIRYAPATNLPSGRADVITFTGADNITAITNYTVRVRVANSTSAIHYRDAVTSSPNSLTLEFYRPDYAGAAMITPLAPVSPAFPNTIYATITTSTLEFTIVNNGAPGNNLEALRFWIPAGIFDPASFAGATSTRVPSGQIVRSGNQVTVYYTNTGQPLLANQSDLLRFRINDLVSYSNVSSVWISASRFSTSGSSYLTNLTVTGKSTTVSLVMPQPAALARLLQNEVYTTSRTLQLKLQVSNTGSGSNALKRVLVTVPAVFRGGLSAASLTNSLATNVSYAAGVFTLTYGALNPGQQDTVYLQLSNGSTTAVATTFAVTADNATFTASATEWTTGALELKVVTPPSGYVEATSPKDGIYNRLWSTDYQNQVKFYIRNDGTGSRTVKRAYITAPTGFVLSAASSRITSGFVTVSSNTVTLDYSGGGAEIGVSETDTVTLTLTAPFVSGSVDALFSLVVRDIDPSGLNAGFSATRLYSGKSWTIGYHHPAPSATYFIDGYPSGTKPSILVAPRGSIASTNILLTVQNTGVSSNLIHRLRFTVPDIFTIAPVPVSARGAVCQVSANTVNVWYSNVTPLVPGATDTVTLQLSYALEDSTNNLPFAAWTDNGSAFGFTAASLKSGWFDTLDVKYPPLSVFAGVVNTDSVYTIFTNAALTYRIKNRAQGYKLISYVITNFQADVFDSVTVSSPRATVSTNPNGTIRLDFNPANAVSFNEVETVSIGLKYRITNNLVTTLTLQGICTMTNELLSLGTNITATVLDPVDTDIGNKDNQRLKLGPAPFANLAGSVLPRIKTDPLQPGRILPNIVTVEVVRTTNTTVVTTPYLLTTASGGGLVPASLSVYTDPATGLYSLAYVPQGSFRLRLSAQGFKTLLTNISVVSNTVVTLPPLELRNALLDGDSPRQQVVVDYDDTNTRFLVESGGLLDQFSLDISVVDMTDLQEAWVQLGGNVKNISATAALGCFRFDLYDNAGRLAGEMPLGGDATLVLHYTSSGLNLPIPALGTDWADADLAIYYWKESTREWVPLGGLVDQAAKTITARVNYLHRFYAVLSMADDAASKPIYNVKASPNPFTPGRGGDSASNLKLTFAFSRPAASYTVTIYNLKGQRVRYFKRDGSLGQGEIFWDGRHDTGFKLPGGVYIYQIRANGQVYSGSVLMLQ